MEQNLNNFLKCFCRDQKQFADNELTPCKLCHKKCHNICYNVKNIEIGSLYCLNCRLSLADPFLPIQRFASPLIIMSRSEQTIPINLTYKDYVELKNEQSILIIFCMLINPNNQNFNTKTPIIYQWASNNIAIKVNDSPITFDLQSFARVKHIYLSNPENKINIMNYKLPESEVGKQPAVIGMAFAKQYDYAEISHKIINDSKELDWNEKYVRGTKDEGCFIKMMDPITNMKINIPMRGKNCNHWDVIDLENFLFVYSNQFNYDNKRWSCPYCKNKIYWSDIQIDYYLYGIFQEIEKKYRQNWDKLKEIKQISIFKDSKGKIQYEEDIKMHNQKSNEMEIEQESFKTPPLPQIINKDDFNNLIDQMYNSKTIKEEKLIINFIKKNQNIIQQLNLIQAYSLLQNICPDIYSKIKKFCKTLYKEGARTFIQCQNNVIDDKYFYIVCQFAIDYSSNLEILIKFIAIFISGNKSQYTIDLDTLDQSYCQLHTMIYIFIALTDHLRGQNNEVYLKFFNQNNNKNGFVFGKLLKKFCQIFDFMSNIQIAKIIQCVDFVTNDLKFVKEDSSRKSIFNTVYFIKEIMSLQKNDLEDGWISLLIMIYQPAISEIQSKDKICQAKLFMKFLIVLCNLTFNEDKMQDQFMEILKLWDEDGYFQKLIRQQDWKYEDNLDYVQDLL